MIIDIETGSQALINGELVVFPTETVYGLGADATCDAAVQKIFKAKSRPLQNPLILHCHSLDQIQSFAQMNNDAERLAKNFWPGPLTLILPKKSHSSLSLLVSAGLPNIAVRIPSHEVAFAFLQRVNTPVAAPSANISGQVSATKSHHIDLLLPYISGIIEGGDSQVGIESTIIDMAVYPYIIRRLGKITIEDIQKILPNITVETETYSNGLLLSPGLMKKHYAPSRPVILNAKHVKNSQALLAFGKNVPQGAGKIFYLSQEGSLEEAAHNLYHMLHEADNPAYDEIAIMEIPNKGIGIAINDRLNRAAYRDEEHKKIK